MSYPSHATAAIGTILKRESPAGSGVYAAVAEVMKLKGPTEALETIEVTNLDSQGTREYIQGLHDGGEVTFGVNWNTGHEVLRVFGPPVNWQIYLPLVNGVTLGHLSFAAFVTKFDRNFDEKSQLTVDMTLKVTGFVTFTAGS
jgi:hypothetical protein